MTMTAAPKGAMMRWPLRLPGKFRLPRQTIRLRLTLLYGVLFLLSGALLLGITYVLVSRATAHGYTYTAPSGASARVEGKHLDPEPGNLVVSARGLTEEQVLEQSRLLEAQAEQQRADQMRELLVQSGVALCIMAFISILLGWIVAGRVLRRVRTITATAREISANNLHERLALEGPVDELKELGDTIDDLLARLESAFQAQRRFIANASHELRTPLARQRVIVQVALSDPDATVESLRAAHERVLVSGEQQERLINALLTLARGQAGLDVRKPFDLAEVVRQVVASRRADADVRGVRLGARLTPARAAGKADLVERLVVNLVDNALRYNVPNGVVDVVVEERAGQAVLSVTNTGPVVAEADLERLFQPFQRVNRAERRGDGGLGLGLSIVQAIVTAHGAAIDAVPRPEGGLAITVTFPPPHQAPNQSDSTRPTSAIDRGLTMSR
jgi:signal transduction histidine kinase